MRSLNHLRSPIRVAKVVNTFGSELVAECSEIDAFVAHRSTTISALALLVIPCFLLAGTLRAESFRAQVAPLIESSCIACHDAGTETGLNLQSLGHDLSDDETFGKWERIFDRVAAGEMPPESEDRPDPQQVEDALSGLKRDLHAASLASQQRVGRVPARRLTKREFGYTLRDLLLIEGDFTTRVPDEVESGHFDTVGQTQRISAVHMESYLAAADEALRAAIRLGRNPYRSQPTNYAHLEAWHDKPVNLGGSVTRALRFGPGVALFRDVDYLTMFQFGVSSPGMHRLTAEAAAYQSKTPVIAKLIVKDQTGAARLAKSIDLMPGEPETIIVDTFLRPGDTPYLSFDMEGKEPYAELATAGGSRNYSGRGMAILSQEVAGPIFESWPPPSSRQLLEGVELAGADSGSYRVQLSKPPLEHIAEIVGTLAPRAFRRPPEAGEIETFVRLAEPAIAADRDFVDALRLPLRSMLSSPQFLVFAGQPGPLDDYALANRLSYFLWKSMPDEELFALAADGTLAKPTVLAAQVDRMLEDEKSKRFVNDFVGQWLRLDKVNVTSPDASLYPEFDELLSDAIPNETEMFFAHLVNENLSLTNLIDSDFTFLNRRLAEHYGIDGVEGQFFRPVDLPKESPRGGVLTHAAILKTTANGTTTSPVMRGNFVLTNFLGTPPSPPPPGIGSIEPDTRGQTTIRDILAAHREIDTCNRCHRHIDPPGFAMESFDPIGGFRSHYRISGGEQKFGDFIVPGTPKQGLVVDPSGVTSDGKAFSGMEQFKQHLMDQKEQVARNLISQLVIYSTGGEIQFADREAIETLVQQTGQDGFRVRDMIHQVVQSRLFRKM